MVTFNIFLGVILLVSFLLILVVMVQQPKGGGLSSSFGGNAQVVGGVKKTGDFLDKSTWTLGTLLIVCILLSNIVLKQNKGDISNSRVLEGHKQETTTPVLPSTPTNNETPNK